MRSEKLTQVELTQERGLSQARVNQLLTLLKLPEKEIRHILVMGDHRESIQMFGYARRKIQFTIFWYELLEQNIHAHAQLEKAGGAGHSHANS